MHMLYAEGGEKANHSNENKIELGQKYIETIKSCGRNIFPPGKLLFKIIKLCGQ